MRTAEARVYYREADRFIDSNGNLSTQYHPRGLVVARYNEETDRIDLGFSLCSTRDVFNRQLANRIALGRLNSGKFSVNPERLNQLEIELPSAHPSEESPFITMLPEFEAACEEVMQRRNYLNTQNQT